MSQSKLKEIKNRLVTFFENHAQINDVVFEDDFDFNAERSLTYPVVNIEWLGSNANGKLNTHSYQIVLSDLVDENIKGHEDEIYSDMMLIAEDLFAWLQEQEGFDFKSNVAIKKITDDGDDRTSGLSFTIQLSTIMSQNVCAIPVL